MKRRAIIAAVLVAGVTLSACATAAGSSPKEGKAPFEVPGSLVKTTNVDLPKSYKFVPAVIEIAPGSTVTWTNRDNFPHTVKLLDGSEILKQLPIGGSTSITFDHPGVFYYECSIHPTLMHGKVIVEGA